MKIISPIEEFRNSILTLKEFTWNTFVFCIENNPELILKSANNFELESLIKESESLPNSEEGWKNFAIVGSYCGPLKPEEYAQVLKKREKQIRAGVEIFRKHLKGKG